MPRSAGAASLRRPALRVPRMVPDIFMSDQEKTSGKIWTAMPRMRPKPSWAEVMSAQPTS